MADEWIVIGIDCPGGPVADTDILRDKLTASNQVAAIGPPHRSPEMCRRLANAIDVMRREIARMCGIPPSIFKEKDDGQEKNQGKPQE